MSCNLDCRVRRGGRRLGPPLAMIELNHFEQCLRLELLAGVLCSESYPSTAWPPLVLVLDSISVCTDLESESYMMLQLTIRLVVASPCGCGYSSNVKVQCLVRSRRLLAWC